MKNAGSFCLVKNMTSHNKNLVFKPLFVNKSILFSSYFSCFKNEKKKEKERVFYKRKTWRYGEIFAKIAGNWLRMITTRRSENIASFLFVKCHIIGLHVNQMMYYIYEIDMELI